jgi:hypothetical protein
MWRETMNHYVYEIDIMKDVSKIIGYLKIRSLHHVTSYFWWGEMKIEHLHRRWLIEIEKTLFGLLVNFVSFLI